MRETILGHNRHLLHADEEVNQWGFQSYAENISQSITWYRKMGVQLEIQISGK